MAAKDTLDALAAAVTKTTDVEQAAIEALNGVAARIQTAVEAALANGATAEQLAPVQAEADSLNAKADALAAAIVANT